MDKLKCFIGGMLTVIVATPILEEITEIICGYLEVLKGNSTKKVLEVNKAIQELQTQIEPIDTSCIGFQVPNQEEEYDEDWEEDKIKIGFK